MNFIKSIFVKIGAGFLYGAGFFIALALVGSFAIDHIYDSSEENIAEVKAKNLEAEKNIQEERRKLYRQFDETALLTALVTKERIDKEEFTLLGTLENKGDAAWSSVKLKAELFNEKGEFIDECSDYVSQTINPGTKINFKLSCSSCRKINFENYHSYKLEVVNASYRD